MRAAPLAAGLLVLAMAWLLPLEALAPGRFSAFMIRHMGVIAVAAPLLSLGLAGGRLDPVRARPGLFSPVPASLVELGIVWAWHAPGLHEAARNSAALLALEQASFLASGLWVWLAALGGDRRPDRQGAGVLALLLTTMHMTLLGALLALSPRPVYAYGPSHGAAVLSPLADQHLGGAIMLALGGAAYLVGGLALTLGLLSGVHRQLDPHRYSGVARGGRSVRRSAGG